MCAVATGTNSIPVSPNWGKTLLAREEPVNAEGRDVGENPQPLAVQSHSGTTPLSEEGPTCKRDPNSEPGIDAAEGDRPQDTRTQEPRWWREHGAPEDTTSRDTLSSVGMTAILRVELAGIPCEALLDTGASRSFISPGAVERLQLKVWRLPDACVFTVANVGPVPYDLVVGLDWLTNHRVAWYFQSDKLHTYVKGQWCDQPVVRTNDAKLRSGSTQGRHQRTPAEQAYDILAKQVADMTNEEATALLRLPAKKYKSPPKGRRKAVVAVLLQQATENSACIRHPLQGLNAILALPAVESNVALRLVEERQGAFCCVMVETSPPNLHHQYPTATPTSAVPEDEEPSPSSTVKLEYSQFDG
ncbi:hypothetical protein EPH_0013920 [Eimeria praecox]|uniref:Peptidase A2 domain-containing protein n=1 Tax=Eimeria praecox TaxID=51316 RepID=U6GXU6_9EIME|nr:hypothetical protein EPH_0013920 [Eimeria praecox]